MLGLVVLIAFQACTSELSEIDGVIGDNIDSSIIDDGRGDNFISIPSESFLSQYFFTDNGSPISTRIENQIHHDFNSPVDTNKESKDLSAKWTGNFYFEAGEYDFSIKSNKGIKITIDDNIVLNEPENQKVTSYSINQQLDGIHKLTVEYNIEDNILDSEENNSSIDTEETVKKDSNDNNAATEIADNNKPVVEVDNSTPTVEVDWTESKPEENSNIGGGVFYTLKELEIWRERSKSGPYKTKGDFGTNSPGDWDRIYKSANELLSGKNEGPWRGESTTSIEPGWKHDRVRDAAFVYLLTEDSKFARPVINFLVTQAKEPLAQWPNRKYISDMGLFSTAGWMIKMLTAYSFVKNEASSNDQSTIERWFREGAEYYKGNMQNDLSKNFPNRLNEDYSVRERNAKDGAMDNKWAYYDRDGKKYNQISVLGKWYNNRRANMIGYMGYAGVFFKNAELIHHSKIFFKEMLMFGTFPDGTMCEYERNTDYDLPFAGVTYSSINIEMFTVVADALARTGDFELYQYSTSKGLFGTEGGEKSLELLIKNYYDQLNNRVERYALMKGKLYRIDMINELDQDRHWVNDTWFVKANLYYKNDYFLKTYTRTLSTSKPYPAYRWGTAGKTEYPWSGTDGMMPGNLFMYGGIESKISIF